MRKKFYSVALFAVLGTLAVSCQKESITDIMPETSISEAGTVYTVQYAVNGVLHTATLHSDEEYNAFVMQLIALAREGYEVEFRDGDASSNVMPTKEVVTYTTDDEKDATEWSVRMIKKGYKVTVSFDSNTNLYTCVATK